MFNFFFADPTRLVRTELIICRLVTVTTPPTDNDEEKEEGSDDSATKQGKGKRPAKKRKLLLPDSLKFTVNRKSLRKEMGITHQGMCELKSTIKLLIGHQFDFTLKYRDHLKADKLKLDTIENYVFVNLNSSTRKDSIVYSRTHIKQLLMTMCTDSRRIKNQKVNLAKAGLKRWQYQILKRENRSLSFKSIIRGVLDGDLKAPSSKGTDSDYDSDLLGEFGMEDDELEDDDEEDLEDETSTKPIPRTPAKQSSTRSPPKQTTIQRSSTVSTPVKKKIQTQSSTSVSKSSASRVNRDSSPIVRETDEVSARTDGSKKKAPGGVRSLPKKHVADKEKAPLHKQKQTLADSSSKIENPGNITSKASGSTTTGSFSALEPVIPVSTSTHLYMTGPFKFKITKTYANESIEDVTTFFLPDYMSPFSTFLRSLQQCSFACADDDVIEYRPMDASVNRTWSVVMDDVTFLPMVLCKQGVELRIMSFVCIALS